MNMSSKITSQSISGLISTLVTAAYFGLSEGFTLEAGTPAAGVAVLSALLVFVGYMKPETNPSPSARETILQEREALRLPQQ